MKYNHFWNAQSFCHHLLRKKQNLKSLECIANLFTSIKYKLSSLEYDIILFLPSKVNYYKSAKMHFLYSKY